MARSRVASTETRTPMRRRRSAPWSVLLALASVTAALALAPAPALADATPPAVRAVSEIPGVRYGAALVAAGDVAYLFGGAEWYEGTRTIHRYDPADGSFTLMGATLPQSFHSGAGVWTGTHVLLFGGCTGGWCALSDLILRYDPATDTVVTMGARLAQGVHDMSAVWTGTHAYVFGGATHGCGGWCGVSLIQRYDPATDTLVVIPTRMPASAWWDTSAVWTGDAALIVGGVSYTGAVNRLTYHDTVLRFDTATETLVELAPKFEGPIAGTRSAWLDGALHVFTRGGPTVRLDPAAGTSTVMHGLVPGHVCCAQPLVVDGRAHVLSADYARRVTVAHEYDPSLDFPNAKPTLTVPAVATVECSGRRGTVEVAATTGDGDGDALAHRWSGWAPWPYPQWSADGGPTARGTFPFGSWSARVDVTDARQTASAPFRVDVVDTLPPTIEAAPLERAVYAFGEPEPALQEIADAHGGPVVVGHVTLVARATDACGIESVTFDGPDGVEVVERAPFQHTVHVPAGEVGERSVTITARDLGGHTASTTVRFLAVGTFAKALPATLGPGWTNTVRDGVCLDAVERFCESVVGPDPYADW